MGIFFKRTNQAADLTGGERCRATVEHADMRGRGSSHFNLSEGKGRLGAGLDPDQIAREADARRDR